VKPEGLICRFGVKALLLTVALLTGQIFAQRPVEFADPFVGTGGDHGQTFPGAILPFGMVAASPDTYPSSLNHEAHAGYNYDDKKIVGFSHFRMSGVGCEGVGGILSILPSIGDPKSLDPAAYAQLYDKASEIARPGYYAVRLIPSSIFAQLTVTQHASLHRYTFPPNAAKTLLIDLRRGSQVVDEAKIARGTGQDLEGSIRTRQMCDGEEWKPGWYKLYFYIAVSARVQSMKFGTPDALQTTTSAAGKDVVAELDLARDTRTAVVVKIGFSEINTERARRQLNKEVAGWDFDVARKSADQAWNAALGRIAVDGPTDLKRTFYTSLYHSMLLPEAVSDVDSQYRGTDEKLHTSANFRYYSSWTLWDTYRTQMPLLSLLNESRARDMCSSLAAIFAERYSEQAVGYWPLPTARLEGAEQYLVDSMKKGICHLTDQTYVNVRDALDARLEERRGGSPYEPRHTARTLDDDYAAWAVGEWAKIIHRPGDTRKYHEIASNYRTLWNPVTGFFGAKDRGGNWLPEKDPKVVDDDYLYEGTMWQYRWTVPFDLKSQTALIGGNEKSARELKEFFDADLFTIANEPDINYPYLFDYLGQPWLTQRYVHRILLDPVRNIYGSHEFYPTPVIRKAFLATPDGLLPEMDDDGGTMSAWFVLSSMGIYPVTIGEPFYFLTTPIFRHVVLRLQNGKSFRIDVHGDPIRDCYIQSVTLNGRELWRAWLQDSEIRAGGTLNIRVGPAANRAWGIMPPPY
jgi:predicted alpha-1,2-mannosidase